MNKKKKNLGAAVAMGAGLAAATIGAYLLFGPSGKKNRKAIRGWIIKMKGEVIEQLEKAKHVTEPVFNQIIDTISARYKKVNSVDKKELEKVISEMRKHWRVIAKEASSDKRKK